MGISSIIILPIIVIYIIIYGAIKKINIYDEFLVGAKEGLITTFKIIPNIVAMIFAINILIKSNIISDVFCFLDDALGKFSLSSDILPMCFLRSISGTSTLAIMVNIFNLRIFIEKIICYCKFMLINNTKLNNELIIIHIFFYSKNLKIFQITTSTF